MSSTLHIYFLADLYEVEVNGTLVKKVTKHSQDGYYKELEFDELPEQVQSEIIQRVLENFK